MHRAEEEAQWLARLAVRDDEVLTWVIKTHHGSLLRLAQIFVGEADAEEVCQETWIKVLKGISAFQGRSSLKTWIFSILINQAKTHLRNKGQSRSTHDAVKNNTPMDVEDASCFDVHGHWQSPPEPWHEETPEALFASQELRDCLQTTLKTLPDQQRLVCTLHDLEGLKMVDLCNILQVSYSNGRVLLHRARIRLMKVVESYQRGEGC